MLNCRACLWRRIQALDTTQARSQIRRNAANSLHLGRQRRSQSSGVDRRTEQHHDARPEYMTGMQKLVDQKKEPWRNSPEASNLKRWAKRGESERPSYPQRFSRDGTEGPRKFGLRDPSMSMKDWQNRKRELTHLTDPLKLAAYVRDQLSKGRVAEMQQLVRMASHDMQCVVSWNHLIDHTLTKGNVGQAVKLYNEMKKRAQFPDSYTYTILLKGLALNAHVSGAPARAITIYHSMSSPNSRVEPTIIHTNAVLKVCSRALDMDGLWGVAGKIPEKGPASANAITYATILGAIRMDLLVNAPKGESDEDRAKRKDRGIVAGRRIWEDVIAKWRNADLIIEEELVTAMGRLLLVGARPRDWDDVLSLVEQTMNIQRKAARIGTASRTEAGFPHLRLPDVPEQVKYDDDHLSPSKEPVRGDEFLPVKVPDRGDRFRSSPLTYAIPGNNTLSMIQDACLKIVAAKAANIYWDLFTGPGPYQIIPDLENMNMRLRVLRQHRASSDAVKFLKEVILPREKPRLGTFRIAMSTCVRDKNNPNSMANANQILDIMRRELEDVDSKTITMYADLAKDFSSATALHYRDSLARLAPIAENLRIQLSVGSSLSGSGSLANSRLVGEQRTDAIAALNRIQGLYDKFLFSDLVKETEKGPFRKEKARLSEFLQRVMGRGDPVEAARKRREQEEKGGKESEEIEAVEVDEVNLDPKGRGETQRGRSREGNSERRGRRSERGSEQRGRRSERGSEQRGRNDRIAEQGRRNEPRK